MKRVSYGTYSLIFEVVYFGLATNVLLAIACLPEILLLLTTDPASSWPLCALAAPLIAPAMTASFAAFRQRGASASIYRAFARGWLETWRKALLLGAPIALTVTVLLVDARMFAGSSSGVVLIPVFAVLTLLVVAVGVVGLVAISDVPRARLRDVVRASIYLVIRRWYVTAGTLVILALQLVLFERLPLLALAITAGPVLYLVWANGRYTLAPVLDRELDATAQAASIPRSKDKDR